MSLFQFFLVSFLAVNLGAVIGALVAFITSDPKDDTDTFWKP